MPARRTPLRKGPQMPDLPAAVQSSLLGCCVREQPCWIRLFRATPKWDRQANSPSGSRNGAKRYSLAALLRHRRKLPRNSLEVLMKRDAVSERVTDKMPTNYLNLGMIHMHFPEARILHCKRHPVDNCISIYTTPGLPSNYAHRKEDIVFIYEQYRRLMEHWQGIIPTDRLMSVQYEDLLNDPETTIRSVISFCGLEWDIACLQHDRTRARSLRPAPGRHASRCTSPRWKGGGTTNLGSANSANCSLMAINRPSGLIPASLLPHSSKRIILRC